MNSELQQLIINSEYLFSGFTGRLQFHAQFCDHTGSRSRKCTMFKTTLSRNFWELMICNLILRFLRHHLSEDLVFRVWTSWQADCCKCLCDMRCCHQIVSLKLFHCFGEWVGHGTLTCPSDIPLLICDARLLFSGDMYTRVWYCRYLTIEMASIYCILVPSLDIVHL